MLKYLFYLLLFSSIFCLSASGQCLELGTPCDDGITETFMDFEDGECNCLGFESGNFFAVCPGGTVKLNSVAPSIYCPFVGGGWRGSWFVNGVNLGPSFSLEVSPSESTIYYNIREDISCGPQFPGDQGPYETIPGDSIAYYVLVDPCGTNSPSIINVIPNSIPASNDIAFDGKYLWVEGFQEYSLFQISPADGAIIKSIPTDVSYPSGLTFDGNHLWLADSENNIIQKIDTLNGAVLSSFPTPADASQSYSTGLAWDGVNLWNNDFKTMATINVQNDSLFHIDTDGNIINSFEHFSNVPTGLAFDGRYLWSSDNFTNKIYKIDTSTFTIIDSFDAPGANSFGGNTPSGLTFDGQYLWVSNNASDSIYQIDIGFVPTSGFVDEDSDGYTSDIDCDDNNPEVNPGQSEEPYNGIDDDCDTTTLDDDLDQDGFPLANDCDDNNLTVHPNQIEGPYNGIDDDCDAATLDDDLDQDGFLVINDCDDNNPTINPDADDIPNNGIDEDCDGANLISSLHEIATATINIYPNPATDVIYIHVSGQLDFHSSLYDLGGKLVKTSNNHHLRIEDLPSGSYLLEIKDRKSGQKIIESIVIGR